MKPFELEERLLQEHNIEQGYRRHLADAKLYDGQLCRPLTNLLQLAAVGEDVHRYEDYVHATCHIEDAKKYALLSVEQITQAAHAVGQSGRLPILQISIRSLRESIDNARVEKHRAAYEHLDRAQYLLERASERFEISRQKNGRELSEMELWLSLPALMRNTGIPRDDAERINGFAYDPHQARRIIRAARCLLRLARKKR